MREYRPAIQQELRRIEPLPYDVSTFHDRRARAARRRRVSAAAVGILVGGVVVASLASILSEWNASEPASTPITPSTVSALDVAWSADAGASIDSAPVVSGGRIFVTTTAGTLISYPTECGDGSRACPPIWIADTASSFDVGGPGVGDGMVFGATADGSLLGYPVTCAPGTCAPTWVARPGGDLSAGAPVVAGGRVYVGSTDGTFSAFAVGCATYPDPCPAVWTAHLRGGYGARGYAAAEPVVVGDVVYVGSTGGTLYAFPASCRGRCEPSRAMELPGALANPLVVQGDSLLVTAGDALFAFSRRCLDPESSCGASWIGRAGALILSPPAVGSSFVYVGTTEGSVVAFPLRCGERGSVCRPSWSISGLGRLPNPSVVDGVLFVGSTWAVNDLLAFDARCGESGGSCDPLWTYQTADLGAFLQPTVSDGEAVYAVTGEPTGGGEGGPGGTVYVFRIE
jgi:outer membrane protein assembly factor BamB